MVLGKAPNRVRDASNRPSPHHHARGSARGGSQKSSGRSRIVNPMENDSFLRQSSPQSIQPTQLFVGEGDARLLPGRENQPSTKKVPHFEWHSTVLFF